MKPDQKQKAEELYFQTDMTKSEIAAEVGVNRRTIMLWCQEGNWEKLRMSARHMPSLVAEKCYHILDRYLSSFLVDGGVYMLGFQPKHADTINKLASTIKKLKNRSTPNESMEMFNFFLSGLSKHEPELANEIAPHIEEYIASRVDRIANDFLLDEFDQAGALPHPAKDINESILDKKDAAAFEAELAKTKDYESALQNWQNETPPSPPPADSQSIHQAL